MSHRSPIPDLPPVEAPAPMLAEARANCAERLRACGYDAEAEMFASGQRDGAWRIRHELNKLRSEAAKA